MSTSFDPITLEILWSRLGAIADEAATILAHTSFSTVVRESKDLTCVLFDAKGRSLCQASWSIPSFTGTLPLTMKHVLAKYPPESWVEGDAAITNDPWLGTGHLPDINLVIPIFLSAQLVGFVGLVAHTPDIGGRTLSAMASEIFEEGLRIPILRLCRQGEMDPTIVAFIENNVRVPAEVLGDLNAMLSAGRSASRSALALMYEFGLSSLVPLAEEIHRRSGEAMRRAISDIPAGEYPYTLRADGIDDTDVLVQVAVRVLGDRIEVDYAGTSPQVGRGINAPYCYTYSYSLFAVKCLVQPDLPNNEGAFTPISVSAPPGSILNPSFPAATGARSTTGHLIVTAIISALAPVIPERAIAESGSPRPIIVMRGLRDDGAPFSQTVFVMGSMGASSSSDGISCIAFPTNTAVTPVEALECTTPVRVRRKEILQDSGGAGTFRGGAGQRVELEVLCRQPVTVSVRGDRAQYPARGVLGGLPGSPTRVSVDGVVVSPKGLYTVCRGQTICIDTPGSGGYGPPGQRSPELMARDVEDGYVSPPVALEVYGYAREHPPSLKEETALASSTLPDPGSEALSQE